MEKVVFTAAIMDMCHRGHINLLKEMKKRGNYTIIVIHSDKACYQIKDKFPIQDVYHRRRNILATGLVDEVMITTSVDPADKFINILNNNSDAVFIRGDDNMNPPGKWLLDEKYVEQIYLPYTRGISSTKLRQVIDETANS